MRSRVRRLTAPVYATAASVLLLLGALAGWGVASLTDGSSRVDLDHYRWDPDGDWFRVETELGTSSLTLSVGNLEPLEGQSTYQLWAVRDERWLPVGNFKTNPEGFWRGDFEFSVERGDTIAITVEPSAGSETPTPDEPEIKSRI